IKLPAIYVTSGLERSGETLRLPAEASRRRYRQTWTADGGCPYMNDGAEVCRILPSDPAMVPSPAPKTRLAYIDWIRGLACLLMFQTHCYDSWLGGSARQSRFFMYSQLGGTFPAPLFLFVAGISFALVTERLRQKNLPPEQIAR